MGWFGSEERRSRGHASRAEHPADRYDSEPEGQDRFRKDQRKRRGRGCPKRRGAGSWHLHPSRRGSWGAAQLGRRRGRRIGRGRGPSGIAPRTSIRSRDGQQTHESFRSIGPRATHRKRRGRVAAARTVAKGVVGECQSSLLIWNTQRLRDIVFKTVGRESKLSHVGYRRTT